MAMRTVTGAALGPVMSRTVSQEERKPASPMADKQRVPMMPGISNVKFSFPRDGAEHARRNHDEGVKEGEEVGPLTPMGGIAEKDKEEDKQKEMEKREGNTSRTRGRSFTALFRRSGVEQEESRESVTNEIC